MGYLTRRGGVGALEGACKEHWGEECRRKRHKENLQKEQKEKEIGHKKENMQKG